MKLMWVLFPSSCFVVYDFQSLQSVPYLGTCRWVGRGAAEHDDRSEYFHPQLLGPRPRHLQASEWEAGSSMSLRMSRCIQKVVGSKLSIYDTDPNPAFLFLYLSLNCAFVSYSLFSFMIEPYIPFLNYFILRSSLEALAWNNIFFFWKLVIEIIKSYRYKIFFGKYLNVGHYRFV